MLQLPVHERFLLYLVLAAYAAAGIAAALRLSGEGRRSGRALPLLIAAGVCLQAVLLVLRGIEIRGFPLTGLFESMVFLGIAFGAAWLFLRPFVPQVWFGSAMTWILLLIAILGAKAAAPAGEVHHAARTPLAIAHGLAMILSAAMVAFATVSAWMYLLANKRLKKKELGKVLGRMPNIEKLRRMNLLGIGGAFVVLAFGLFAGLGMAAGQISAGETSLADWLTDPKTVLVIVSWALLGAILILRPAVRLGGRAVAYLTVIAFFLILFAMVGVSFFCGTRHVFSHAAAAPVVVVETA